MVQILTSIKNTFVHVDVDSPDDVEMGSKARRRASSTPARVTLDVAEKEEHSARAIRAQGPDELLLFPHDDDDYTSMHAHPGPSPLDMCVEGMLGCHVPEMDVDDYFWGVCVSQPEDETTPDLVNAGMDIDDTVSEEKEAYSASAPAYHGLGLTYGAQLPNDNHRVSMGQNRSSLSAAPMSPHEPAQLKTFSAFPIPPLGAQRDLSMQSHSGNLPARVPCDAKHGETQGEEKRTTVMLMNVPLRYKSSKLMHDFDSEGFAGMYDFIYVPMAAARSSKGYAFVNWVNPSIAQQFLSAFNGFSRWSITSKNVCQTVWAKQHQGLQANIDRYRNSTVLGKTLPDEYKPRIFNDGREMPFPPPVRKPCAPTRRLGQPRKRDSQQALWL
eukprot:TRINITY_DN4931_c4_g1_i1.p1 TRINITY_DN4931_c4_g1~~TRINITY_DN4931_c4_g1_i1.p1  ORF type:complete len:384 (+),score=58.94 TRINITY_DN4931_c4_g1_i1:53-1204(+)